MKKLFYVSVMFVLALLRASAQETSKPPEYKVPPSYHFDYKVVYEHNDVEDKTSGTMTYYFTKSGDYMGMENTDSENDDDMNFMIRSKDGLMITFGKEPMPGNSDKTRNVIKVMNMRGMLKDSGEALTNMAKALSKNEKVKADKKEPNELDNFIKTGKTKLVFGYTADEYSKEFSETEKGKTRTGTMSIWYAKVDFDPEMMFSLGMGALSGDQSQSKLQKSNPDNMIGLGLTQKNYLLVEVNFLESGGKSETGMKVTSIEKTNFNVSTAGYFIKNYAGMSMKEMMMKESE